MESSFIQTYPVHIVFANPDSFYCLGQAMNGPQTNDVKSGLSG